MRQALQELRQEPIGELAVDERQAGQRLRRDRRSSTMSCRRSA